MSDEQTNDQINNQDGRQDNSSQAHDSAGIQGDSDSPGQTVVVGQDEDLESLQAQNFELMNRWKRTAADFENFKKRKEVEGKELLEYSKEMTVMKLLPSLQSLEQVLKFAPVDEKYKDWLAGLKATIWQLEKTMEELGVVKIKTVGHPFDPHLHEALEEQESEEEGVVKELQPGFMLNGNVIIPAKVAVGKKK